MRKIILKKPSAKDWILFTTVFFSYFPIVFYGMKTRVYWFVLVDHSRRIDYYFFYLGLSINYLIYSFLLRFPKGLSKGAIDFIIILNIIDVLHFVLLSKLYFGYVKVVAAIGIFYLYQRIKKWVM